MTYIKREEWQEEGYEINGPAPVGQTTAVVFHHPGGLSVPLTLSLTKSWLKSAQRYSLRERGYSFYYNWVLARTGEMIEARGEDFNNAANVGYKIPDQNVNSFTKSILCMVPVGSRLNEEQLNTLRWFLPKYYLNLEQWPHNLVEWTDCPGLITEQLPIEGSYNMFEKLVRLTGESEVYAVYSGGYKVWIPDQATLVAFRERHPTNQTINNYPTGRTDLMKKDGPIMGPINSGVDAYGNPV